VTAVSSFGKSSSGGAPARTTAQSDVHEGDPEGSLSSFLRRKQRRRHEKGA
jgi:hypothetical protein